MILRGSHLYHVRRTHMSSWDTWALVIHVLAVTLISLRVADNASAPVPKLAIVQARRRWLLKYAAKR